MSGADELRSEVQPRCGGSVERVGLHAVRPQVVVGRWKREGVRAMGNRLRSTRRGVAARALALAMALSSVLMLRPVSAEPGDIFTVAAPAISDTPARSAAIGSGDASVSSKTGALTYSFPIHVPPGRVQPGLALSYSSQAPIYGTLSAGFSLEGVPSITSIRGSRATRSPRSIRRLARSTRASATRRSARSSKRPMPARRPTASTSTAVA